MQRSPLMHCHTNTVVCYVRTLGKTPRDECECYPAEECVVTSPARSKRRLEDSSFGEAPLASHGSRVGGCAPAVTPNVATVSIRDVSRGGAISTVCITGAASTVSCGSILVSVEMMCAAAMSAVAGELWRADLPRGARLVHRGRDLLRVVNSPSSCESVCSLSLVGEVVLYCCL